MMKKSWIAIENCDHSSRVATSHSKRCAMQRRMGHGSSCSPAPDHIDMKKKRRRGRKVWRKVGFCSRGLAALPLQSHAALLRCHVKQGGACNSHLDSYPCTGCKPNGMTKRLWMCHQKLRSLVGRNQLTSKASPRGAMQDSLVGCGSC